MMTKILLITLTLLLAAAVAAAAWFWTRSYEEPVYTVIARKDGYELRRYEPYLVAQTTVTGSFEESGNQAFRKLAAYIFGSNTSSEAMAMTAPVMSQGGAPVAGTKMSMTAPVLSTADPATPAEGEDNGAENTSSWTYQFVMERKYSLDTLPEPVDPAVEIHAVPARLVAARSFSGRWLSSSIQAQEALLLAAVRRDGLEVVGGVALARYNDPFMPFFLRRNEVLVEVAGTG